MNITSRHIFFLIGAGLSVFGFIQGLTLSVDQLATGDACPSIGPLPACYLVAIAYGLASVAWLMRLVALSGASEEKPLVKTVFYAGFLPIFILAFIGSASEALGFPVCPHMANGFPKCVISLVVGLIILFSWHKTADKSAA